MNIDKIVAEMPKVDTILPQLTDHQYLFEAQCRLLAEQGWRKLPSIEKLTERLTQLRLNPQVTRVSDPDLFVAIGLHCWLLEGE